MKAAFTSAIAFAALIAFTSPVQAQTCDPIPTGEGDIFPQICGLVWSDTNPTNGTQDDDTNPDPSIDTSALNDVIVTLYMKNMSGEWIKIDDTVTVNGTFYFTGLDDGEYKVVVTTPDGLVPTSQSGGDETSDSDGANDTLGSAAVVTVAGSTHDIDFGFTTSTTPVSPGTGTPGYWKNHPEAWLHDTITIGDVVYSREDAISYMGKVSKDKRTSLFTALVAAKLNVEIGNESSCIAGRITEADLWMRNHQPFPGGTAVAASSADWQLIAPAHQDLDNYNNGRLCAPHRN